MGKNFRRKGGQKFGKRSGERSNTRDNKGRASWVELPKDNAKWESYYKSQNLIPEEEWTDFKLTCQKQLPLTFRITGSRKHAAEILKVFKENHLPKLLSIDVNEIRKEQEEKIRLGSLKAKQELKERLIEEGKTEDEANAEIDNMTALSSTDAALNELANEDIDKPTSLPWYPNEFAWQLNVPKSVMKKNKNYEKTQRFLVVETEVGNISRQEAVSMIPPLVLDVKPDHYVLDMCAAPGSKTAQLVESLHDFGDDEESSIPSGFVVANDSDYKRSHMLVHQVKRLNSPNFVVINHDGQLLPKFKLQTQNNQFCKFDRILCDVPCTGDGTMRKNVNVWKEWSIGNALGMHSLQLNILNRGLQLLKPGGRLVYSTCSLSPIENEAVVAAALKKWGNEIKLVNCDDKLPNLSRRNGVSKWKVFNKDGEELTSLEDLQSKLEVNENNKKVPVTCFPPSEDEAKYLNLDCCMRVYPHLQNTGGFFITVFEKIDHTTVESKKRTIKEEATDTPNEKKQKLESTEEPKTNLTEEEKRTDLKLVPMKKEKLPRDANEEPFIFLDAENKILQKCWDFYDISMDFPRDSTLVRNATGAPVRAIYFVAPIIKDIIQTNENRLKFIHSGLKLFVSQKSNKGDEDVAWRLQNESLPTLKNYLGEKRQIRIKELQVLNTLLVETFPSLDKLREQSEDFYNQVHGLDEGCCFLNIQRQDGEDVFLPFWKGKNNINLMLNKHDTFELLYRIMGVETSKDTIYKQSKDGKNSIIIGVSSDTDDQKREETAQELVESKP